jgi:type II secretory pathway pseudopilin PulG
VQPVRPPIAKTIRPGRGPAGRTLPFLLLAVVLCIASTAGLLVPEWNRARRDRSERALAVDLGFLNDALSRYQRDHDGRLPGEDVEGLDGAGVASALCSTTDRAGAVVPGAPLGPYLAPIVPQNPINGSNEILVVTTRALPVPDDQSGWLLHVASGRFFSNARSGAR